MKFFWKNLSVAIAAMSLIAACSDKSDLGPYTSAVPKPGVKQNIEEKTDYYSNIDWQTYAGDDFYRYATGAWQDATDPGDKGAVGTQHMQEIIMDEFLKKASNGGCPQLQRLITQYKGMEDYSADKQKVKAKLADIDNEVTSKEEAWKKMAQMRPAMAPGSGSRPVWRPSQRSRRAFPCCPCARWPLLSAARWTWI